MSRSLKSLVLSTCIFTGFFVVADFSKVEAACGRWSAYNTERGAWGGNGGSWGNTNSDWYGEYGTPDNYYSGHYSNPNYSSDGFSDNNYHYDNSYPYSQHYHEEPGVGAGEEVNGAGVYFNVR